jgi:hypothetical protein
MKFSAKSSGLSVAEKASLVGIDATGRKPEHAVILFGSNSSASDGESASPRRPWKHVPESGIPKQILEPIPAGGVVFFLWTIITIFSCVCLAVAVVPLPCDGDKVHEPHDVLAKKTLVLSDEIVAREGGVINVTLASRCGGTIECDDLCNVLCDWLQDVSFSALKMPYFLSVMLDYYLCLPS